MAVILLLMNIPGICESINVDLSYRSCAPDEGGLGRAGVRNIKIMAKQATTRGGVVQSPTFLCRKGVSTTWNEPLGLGLAH